MRMSSPSDQFFAQRRARRQRGIEDRRAQIGERAQFFAQPQQPGFRAKLARIVIEGGSADRPEKYGLRSEAGLNGRVGKRIAKLGERLAADFFLFEVEVVAKSVRDFAENADGLRRYFGTDSIAGQSCDSEFHGICRSLGRIHDEAAVQRSRRWRDRPVLRL